jgi:hypothetical protein
MSQESSLETLLQESIVKPLQSFVIRLQRALSDSGGEDLVATLQQNYAEERRLAQQLQEHATLMPNALFADAYAQLIAETEQYACLFAAQIRSGGHTLATDDSQTFGETEHTTFWRLIASDITAINALSARYQTQLGWMTDPQVRQLLHQRRRQLQRQRRMLTDLLARIDSYATPEIDQREDR